MHFNLFSIARVRQQLSTNKYILDEEDVDTHIYVGDSHETPYECAHQTVVLHEKFGDDFFLSLRCSEIAPEGRTVKLVVHTIRLLTLYEVEIYGRSLRSKCNDSLDR